jgi:hypothetical protein
MDKTGMVFCSALMAVILFACPFTAPQEAGLPLPSSPPLVSSPPNASVNASLPANAPLAANASLPDKTEQDWALINKGNVENACTSQAKKTAVAAGYGEGAVFDCICSAQESGETKSYDCSVSALDGQHPLSIICTKSKKTCRVTTPDGEGDYSFDQLQSLANP